MTPSPMRRGKNRGQSSMRQRMAPQPDRSAAKGARPMDRMRQSVPAMPIQNFPQKKPGMSGGKAGYAGMLDLQNQPKGLPDAQVQWMKRNLLGRQGNVSGREGAKFQNQMAQYIQGAGGQHAFQQMLGAMPGFANRAPQIGGPDRLSRDTFRPGQGGGGGGQQQGGARPRDGAPVMMRQAEGTSGKMFPQAGGDRQQAPSGGQKGKRASGGSRATQAAYGEADPVKQAKKEGKYWAGKGIPLSPEFEGEMRNITDQYINALVSLGHAEADAVAAVNMAKERLARNFGQDRDLANEGAAARGVFSSGARLADQQRVSQGYGDQFQDLSISAAQQQRALADQRAALENWRQNAIRQAYLNRARSGFGSALEGPFSGVANY